MRALLDYLIYVCAFSVIGLGALGAWDAVSDQPHRVALQAGQEAGGGIDLTPPPFNNQKKTILLIGSDADPKRNDPGRSDSIILLFLNPQTNKAALLSLPRDLRVRIPGHGMNKINAAFAFGGVDLVRQTIQTEFGITTDYYAHANFNGFVEIVDMLGGVEIDVPDVEGRGRGMNYTDRAGNLYINLRPGKQLLDGTQAMGFVRYRKADSDFARSERQHQFLRAMAEQKLKLRNVVTLTKVARKALDSVETDMTWREAVDAARASREVRLDNLLSVSLQPYLRDRRIGGIYYVEVSETGMRNSLSEIRTHLNTMPGQINLVDVLNGCGEAGVAASVGELLIKADFDLHDTDNAPTFGHERTLIHYPADGLSAARRVQRALACGELVEMGEQSEFSPDRITVIVGSDFDCEAASAASG